MNTNELAPASPETVRNDAITLHIEDYTIRSYETDMFGAASMQTICNYFQNLGYNHALRIRDREQIQDDGRTAFVLTRLHVKMERMPLWRETVRIRSWLSPFVSQYAIRDFQVYGADGALIGTGTNSAVFFDLARRKVTEAPDAFKKLHLPDRPRALDDPFERMARPSSVTYERTFTADMSDIDFYHHVNNVVYITWALDTVPEAIWRTHSCLEMEVNFRSEVGLGGTMISQAEEIADRDGITCIHRLFRPGDTRDAALLRTFWHRR